MRGGGCISRVNTSSVSGDTYDRNVVIYCAKPGGRDNSWLVSGAFIYSRPVRACQGRSDNVRGSELGLRKR